MKKCNKCGEPLVLGETWSEGMARNKTNICRMCNSKKGKDWYAANTEKALANEKKRMESDPAARAASLQNARNWYSRNKERHAEMVKANSKRYRRSPNYRAARMLTWIRARAQRIGCDFDLDYDFVFNGLENGVCEVTGLRFDLIDVEKGDSRINPFGPSIDRVDSSKGYTKDNCRMVVWVYNVAKQDFADEVVMRMATALVEANRGETS